MKTLFSLTEGTEYSLFYNKDVYSAEHVCSLPVDDIIYNSEMAFPKKIFFCISGSKADGHNFAAQAYEKGVRIFVCERVLPMPDDVVQIVVEDSRKALAAMSANFFGHPEKKLKIIGVTGTKGKSSVCEMTAHIFASVGICAATVGTIGIRYAGKTYPTENSTPESYILYKHFAKIAELGIEYVVMEVSSQSVYLDRICGIRFDAAVLTNIYEDHIGPSEHPDFEHYRACKMKVLSLAEKVFLNSDDAYYNEFKDASHNAYAGFGIEQKSDMHASDIQIFKAGNIFGSSFECSFKKDNISITLPVPGLFSVYNAMAAISVCNHFGVSIFDCAHALETVSIKGRFEIVPTPLDGITCIIDYAHNGKSLMNVLETVKSYRPLRIICVFGSIGGRTKSRRKEMALAANALADICIVTSDNPDCEDPFQITQNIAEFISPEKCFCETDREKAIYHAISISKPGDFILFAGKGHEEYQLINGEKFFFSEKEIIIKAASLKESGITV